MITKRKNILIVTICLVVCLALVVCWKLDVFKRVIEVEGYPHHYSYEELVQKSSLIVRGRIVKTSRPIVITPTNGGDDSIFTDHYLEISHVLRGDAQVGEQVAIRTEGGETFTTIVVSEMDPSMEKGDEIVAFLYRHNIGGGYTTKEDYYRILGTDQGLYYLEQNEKEDLIFKNEMGDSFEWTEFSVNLPKYSQKHPVDETWLRKWAEEALEAERKSEQLTEEEYRIKKQALDQYAVVK